MNRGLRWAFRGSETVEASLSCRSVRSRCPRRSARLRGRSWVSGVGFGGVMRAPSGRTSPPRGAAPDRFADFSMPIHPCKRDGVRHPRSEGPAVGLARRRGAGWPTESPPAGADGPRGACVTGVSAGRNDSSALACPQGPRKDLDHRRSDPMGTCTAGESDATTWRRLARDGVPPDDTAGGVSGGGLDQRRENSIGAPWLSARRARLHTLAMVTAICRTDRRDFLQTPAATCRRTAAASSVTTPP